MDTSLFRKRKRKREGSGNHILSNEWKAGPSQGKLVDAFVGVSIDQFDWDEEGLDEKRWHQKTSISLGETEDGLSPEESSARNGNPKQDTRSPCGQY